MKDLRDSDVYFLTVAQYLQPTPPHYSFMRYMPEEDYRHIERQAYQKGFTIVSASPLTHSS